MPAVPIQWPKTTLPGRKIGESQGVLVNAYATQIGDRITIRRAAGLRRELTIEPPTTLAIPRGMYEVGDILFHAWDSTLYRLDADGTNTKVIGVLPGTDRVTFASNQREVPELIIVTKATGAISYNMLTNTLEPYPTEASYPPTEPPTPPNGGENVGNVTSVEYYAGYFFMTRKDGTVIASNLQQADTQDGSLATAEYTSDYLYRTKNIGSSLALMGSKSIEFWVDVGASPFPLQRQNAIDVGLLSPWAVAGGAVEWENGLLWVSGDWTVRMLKGYDAVPVSNDDVVNDIRNATMREDELYAQVYVSNAQAIWSLSCSLWTWEYNLTTGCWHKRESYNMVRWRGAFACRRGVHWLAQDWSRPGRCCLYEISPNVFDEDGERLRFAVDSVPLREFPANMRIPAIDFDMTVGIGTGSGQYPFETNPVVMVSWSHNGGGNWSNPLARQLGAEGRYATKVTVNNLGRSTTQGTIVRVEVVDPVWVQLAGAISTRTQPSRPRGVNQ